MEALRAVLDSLSADKSSLPGVHALLSQLNQADFALDVHICSVGGVGSTELGNFLNCHGITTNLLNDEDNLRHINSPPTYGASGPRSTLYLYGDPLASIASHYRRGHAFHQACKTSGNPRLQQQAFPMSLHAYVQQGQDLFGYEQHFSNWRHAHSSYNIAMVRYEHLWEPGVCLQLLRQLCGHHKGEGELQVMTEAFCAGRRQRQSEVAPELRERMYQELAAAMDAMPPLLVRAGDGRVVQAFDMDGRVIAGP